MTKARPNEHCPCEPAGLDARWGAHTGRLTLALVAALGAALWLPGCDSAPPRDRGGDGGTPSRTDRSARDREPARAPTDVDEEAARYKNLFDAMEFDSLSRSRRRLIEAGKPGINFLVQFLLIRSLAVPVGDVGQGELGQAEGDRIASFRTAAERELVSIGQPGTSYLGEIAERGKTDFARQAARVLALMGETGVPALTAATRRAEPKQRKLLVEALGGSGSEGALETLIEVLRKDDSWQVRGMAAAAIGTLGRDLKSERALAALESSAKNDPDLFVVQKCAEGFITMDDAGGLRGAVAALDRLLAADPPQLAQGKALVSWMQRRSGMRHGLDVQAWKRAIR